MTLPRKKVRHLFLDLFLVLLKGIILRWKVMQIIMGGALSSTDVVTVIKIILELSANSVCNRQAVHSSAMRLTCIFILIYV